MRVTVKQMQEKAQRELAEVSEQVRQDTMTFGHPTCRALVLQHENSLKPPLLPLFLLLLGTERNGLMLLVIQRPHRGESIHLLYRGLCGFSSGISGVQVRVYTYSTVVQTTYSGYTGYLLCYAVNSKDVRPTINSGSHE